MSSTLQLSWRSLPDVTWHGVAAYLPAPDVLSLLSTNREWHSAGRNSEALWTTLLSAQFRHFFTEGNDNESADEEANRRVDGGGDDDAIPRRRTRPRRGSSTTMTAAERRRHEYLALSYRQELPAVEWTPLRVAPGSGPSAREGHLSCVLDDRYLVITGGFSTDTVVWVKDLRGSDDPRYHGSDFHHLEPSHAVAGAHNNSNNARNDRRRDRQREEAEDNADDGNGDLRSLQFAYGATLTPINGRQAVQFGGFRAGGYSHECSQVAVLTLDVASGNGDGGLPRPRFSVSWQVVTTGSERLPGHDDRESAVRCEAYTKRAYHSATLLLNRYLLVLGGMQSSRSIWRPALLDTHTWRWTIPSRSSSPAVPLDRYVPPRHGHTALWDPKRSRVVVFGGGTGSDLLRSGFDHADVWATTKIPDDSVESLVRLLGWGNDGGDSDDDGPSPWTRIVDASSDPLSPTESLCLGRCHVGHCIAPDTVILAFGSGRPSTNGVLAFNLATNTFFRPRVSGPLPCPRFTTTCVLWDSYLIFHGGYMTQRSTALDDMHALDLAPALRRPFRAFPRERRVAPGGVGFASVTDQDVIAFRDRGRPHGMGELEALISLLHNRGNMNDEDFNATLQNLFPAELLRAEIRRVIGADEGDDDEDDDDQRNLDAEMEE